MSYPESKWGPLKQKTGSHLEKIGRPVVLENVSGGHFERKKKTPPPSFFPQRPDAKHVLFFYFALWIKLSFYYSGPSKQTPKELLNYIDILFKSLVQK